MLTSSAEIAAMTQNIRFARQGVTVNGLLTISAARYGAPPQVPFNKPVLSQELIQRARNLRVALQPSDCSPVARAVRGLVDTCPDDWHSQPAPSLVKEVLDRCEVHVALQGATENQIDAMLEEAFPKWLSEA